MQLFTLRSSCRTVQFIITIITGYIIGSTCPSLLIGSPLRRICRREPLVAAYSILSCLLSRSTTSNYSRNSASYLVLLYLPRLFEESTSVWSLTSRYWFATRNRFHWHFCFIFYKYYSKKF